MYYCIYCRHIAPHKTAAPTNDDPQNPSEGVACSPSHMPWQPPLAVRHTLPPDYYEQPRLPPRRAVAAAKPQVTQEAAELMAWEQWLQHEEEAIAQAQLRALRVSHIPEREGSGGLANSRRSESS